MAPPKRSRCSASSTDKPMPARSTAAATPAGPPPTTNTSGCHTVHLTSRWRSQRDLHTSARRCQAGLYRRRPIDRHQTGLAGPDAAKVASAQLPHGRPQVIQTRAAQRRGKSFTRSKNDRVPQPKKPVVDHFFAITFVQIMWPIKPQNHPLPSCINPRTAIACRLLGFSLTRHLHGRNALTVELTKLRKTIFTSRQNQLQFQKTTAP